MTQQFKENPIFFLGQTEHNVNSAPDTRNTACAMQGAASVIQTDALGDSLEIARLDTGHYFGEVCIISMCM